MFNMELAPEDAEVVIADVNVGIDSRLTAFTKSTFEWKYHTISGQVLSRVGVLKKVSEVKVIARKLHCEIHPDEMEILLRRLVWLEETNEKLGENAGLLLGDIVYAEYGVELI